jgi:hypothetical protein
MPMLRCSLILVLLTLPLLHAQNMDSFSMPGKVSVAVPGDCADIDTSVFPIQRSPKGTYLSAKGVVQTRKAALLQRFGNRKTATRSMRPLKLFWKSLLSIPSFLSGMALHGIFTGIRPHPKREPSHAAILYRLSWNNAGLPSTGIPLRNRRRSTKR